MQSDLLADAARRVDAALTRVFGRIHAEHRPTDGESDAHHAPPILLEGMRYATLAPGKRLRPALVLGGAKAVGAPVDDVLPAACAVEMIHAYSLVHDDLPALDNDNLRRGRPTCHRVFGEATAILVGDALLAEALFLISDGAPFPGGRRVPALRRVRATAELARAAGAAGMVGGQQDDLTSASPAFPKGPGLDHLFSIHRRKTGRLIQASAAIGAVYGGGASREITRLRTFGADLGLAFQLTDDALDGDGVARILGRKKAQAEAQRLADRAIEALEPFGRAALPLHRLACSVAKRKA